LKLPSIRSLLGLNARDLLRPKADSGVSGIRQTWTDGVATGLTPQQLAAILRDCDQGEIESFMKLAEEMEERDPHYASVMGQRKRAISGVMPQIVPASEDAKDTQIADWVREHIAEAEWFPALVEHLLDAVGKGFSVVEVDWARDGSTWWPQGVDWRHQRFFKPDRITGEELRLLTDDEPADGELLEHGKFIVHKASLKSGHFFRGGIARVVVFSWMCKGYSLKDWMAFVELYGIPLRLGRYDAAATDDDIRTLFRAVANVGTDAAAVIPKGTDIEFTEAKSGGGNQPVFENLSRYLDEQISKAVLGQTMTTDNGSSMAQANVHNDVRLDIAQADARSVCGTINRDLIAPAVAINFGKDVEAPLLKIEIDEPEDVSARVADIVALAGVGVTFKAAEARSLVRMSDPDKKDELFGGTAKQETSTAALATARSTRGPSDTLDEIEADMLSRWEPVMDEMLGPIRRAIEDAVDLEDALARLDELDGLPQAAMIEDLVIGMFQARANGDVSDG